MSAAAHSGAQHYDAVVVGAGPTGLAAALELRKRGARVALLERSAEPSGYDAERAFLYLVDGRGQAELASLGLIPALLDAAVSQETFKISIVTDSATPVSEPMTLPTADPDKRKSKAPAQWIPRNKLVELMEQAVAAAALDTTDPAQKPIERLYGCELASLALDAADDVWRLRVGGGDDGEPRELTCALLVGADGINSAVRTQLASLAGDGRAFSVVRRPSASAGLRYKVLTLPAAFKLARNSDARAVPAVAYSVRGTPSAARPLKAGLLPLRSDARGRSANFITRADHPLWTHADGGAMAAFLAESFPHVQLDAAVLGAAELERFAASKGGYFPPPQHCTDAALAPRAGRAACAVLAGDALHAFPPDLGQGVNSGLQDVARLAALLDASSVRFGAQADPAAPRQLGAAVAQYGRERAAEASALTRLVQLGAPFQVGVAGRERVRSLRSRALSLPTRARTSSHPGPPPSLPPSLFLASPFPPSLRPPGSCAHSTARRSRWASCGRAGGASTCCSASSSPSSAPRSSARRSSR